MKRVIMWHKDEISEKLYSEEGWHISFADKTSPIETALVGEENTGFYILNGDHRKAYEERIDSWDKCYEYFLQNQKLKSVHSE